MSKQHNDLNKYEQFCNELKDIDPNFCGKEVDSFLAEKFGIGKAITKSGLYKSDKNEGIFVQFEDRVVAFGVFDKMFKQDSMKKYFRKKTNFEGKYGFVFFKLRNQNEFDLEKETILQLSSYTSFSNALSDFKYCAQMI
tara:strand:- start:686 stop:1102 length:417 start_codon:yes stop_codon:yes gene_type:complete